MKKIILSVATLSAALAQAQVGINQETPKATLDISVKTANKTTDSQEGLLIPRVTKEKALLMANNNTTQPEESALIYVNDMALTSSADTTVEDITEKGYYFWNGTKWVKSSGANGELWAQREINGVTETYLKPALANGDMLSYNRGEVKIFSKRASSDSFSMIGADNNLWVYNQYSSYLGKDHINNAVGGSGSTDKRYLAMNSVTSTDNEATQKINFLGGGTFELILGNPFGGNARGQGVAITSLEADNVVGFTSRATNFSSGRVENFFGSVSYTYGSHDGNVGKMKGIEAMSVVRGNTDEAYGVTGLVRLDKNSVTETAFGGSFSVNSKNATINNTVQGLRTDITLDNTTLNNNFSHGLRNILTLKNGSTAQYFEGTNTTFYGDAGTILDEYIGYRLFIPQSGQNKNEVTVKRMYGLKLDDLSKGTEFNYAIHTGKGDIRFGQLEGLGERLVTANDDGVLGTSNKSLADLESLWANDDTAGLVKLKATSNGTPRVNTPGSRNDVTIDDYGKITAKAFIGYNGATIFPDYVFEKYYTGESTIKADYNFHNLASVESFIKTNGHLPGYKSAKEIASKGLIDLGATQLTNVEKIEELYLHTIEQEKAIKSQKEELKAKDAEISQLKADVQELKKLVNQLMNK